MQSLFADGLIRYSHGARRGPPACACSRCTSASLPDSRGRDELGGLATRHADDARARCARIASRAALRGFVARAVSPRPAATSRHLARSVFAVHPGGPKIIDRVRDVLELADSQVAASRGVLFDHGNMSSATLPHIWMRMLDDPRIAARHADPEPRVRSRAHGVRGPVGEALMLAASARADRAAGARDDRRRGLVSPPPRAAALGAHRPSARHADDRALPRAGCWRAAGRLALPSTSRSRSPRRCS